MEEVDKLITGIKAGNQHALAKAISLVENKSPRAEKILQSISFEKAAPVIGFTGPPGAGKSTLVNSLISHLLTQNLKVAVLAIDPSSPFNFGALLGDRIRLNKHYLDERVFIRSLASRGSLGGLSIRTFEIADLVRSAGFDYVFIETVGVGQSEVEIAGISDTTVVVLLPGAGDEVQTMKAGVMEVADIFVVNKADNPLAESYVKLLRQMVHQQPENNWTIPVLPTVATQDEGVEALFVSIQEHLKSDVKNQRKIKLLTAKALKLISEIRMKDIDESRLEQQLQTEMEFPGFNLYGWVKKNFR